MAEKSTSKKVAAAAAAAAAGSNKKVVRSKPVHPNTSEMVLAAVTALKNRKGSSMQAIKKYMSSTYKVDTDKTAIFIRRYLRKAVAEGVLVQAKGNGASGSFNLPSSDLKKPVKSSGKKRGRPAKSTTADASKKKSTPKKKKKQGAAAKKAGGATSAKKPKVKSTTTTKKKAGRPKGAKSTPKKMKK